MRGRKIPSALTGIAGVHYVVSELSRRGMIALPTIRNTAGYDIIVASPDGKRHANIQVKTSSRRVGFWPTPKSTRIRAGPNDFYVFVRWLKDPPTFQGYLLTARTVRREVADGERWQRKRRKEADIWPSLFIGRKNKKKAQRWVSAWKDWGYDPRVASFVSGDAHVWYFAYGSNLHRRKMLRTIGGQWREECTGTAKGFEVVFNKRSNRWGAAANLAAAPRKACHGVLYRITPPQFRKLKASEKGYAARHIQIQTESGESVMAWTFVALPNSITDSVEASEEYIKIILKGGREHRLPQSYLQELATRAKKLGRRDVQ